MYPSCRGVEGAGARGGVIISEILRQRDSNEEGESEYQFCPETVEVAELEIP